MANKRNELKRGAAQAVEGQIIRITFDFSDGIGDIPLEQWTCGPILPVGAKLPVAKNAKRGVKARKKKA